MTGSIVQIIGASAQLACFALFAVASYRHFRQRDSSGHMVTRVASLVLTAVFAALALLDPPAPAGLGLIALAMTGMSALVFRAAVRSADAGVLHVAFADGPSARLVTEGIYGRVRNPFYTAYLTYWGAWVVLLGFSWPAVAGFAFFAVLYWLAARKEEAALTHQFGTAYVLYKSAVGRFLPHLP